MSLLKFVNTNDKQDKRIKHNEGVLIMARVAVEKRTFENDEGRIIPYNVIVIEGYLNGKLEKIEKSVTRVEAMMMGMLLESGEVEVSARKATVDEGEKIEVSNRSKNESIEDLLDL